MSTSTHTQTVTPPIPAFHSPRLYNKHGGWVEYGNNINHRYIETYTEIYLQSIDKYIHIQNIAILYYVVISQLPEDREKRLQHGQCVVSNWFWSCWGGEDWVGSEWRAKLSTTTNAHTRQLSHIFFENTRRPDAHTEIHRFETRTKAFAIYRVSISFQGRGWGICGLTN